MNVKTGSSTRRGLSCRHLGARISQGHTSIVYTGLILLILLLLGSSVQASSHTTTVRVVIEHVEALDNGIDVLSQADFYPVVVIDGSAFGGPSLTFGDDDDIAPNWQFSRSVALTDSPISITIEIWDNDSGLGGDDDSIDLTPGGDRDIDLTVAFDPCAVAGDVVDQCWLTIVTAGDGSNNARIRFRIEVGEPPAMALVTVTIERVIAQDDGIDVLGGQADFYPIVRIDGTELGGAGLTIGDDDDIAPNWQLSKSVPASVGSVDVDVEIWDNDSGVGGDDDKIDVSPNAGRTLDFSVNLIPCTIGGNIEDGDLVFGAACGVTIIQSGNENNDAEIQFRVDVEPPPTIAGFNIRCLHDPLWPQPGESVTITAEVLDDTLNPIPFTTGVTIEIWVDDQVAPDSTDTNVSAHDFVALPPVVATQMTYGCVASTGSFDVWSGWHAVQIGSPTTRAVPVLNVKPVSSAIDIVFIPDQDNYASAADPDFINDIHDAILGSFYGDLFFLQNQRTFNFWLAQDNGDYEEDCEHTTPSNWDSDYAFAEAGGIIHTDALRDCARGGKRIFSGEVGEFRVFLHEAGHQPFGEADEYCCDGGYFQTDPFPNIYENSAACGDDSINVGKTPADCRMWTDDDGEDWFTSDPATNDLMVDNQTPQALDIRRIEWLLNNCNSSAC